MHVTFPQNPYYKGRKSNKNEMIMTYIIQQCLVRIVYNEKDFGEHFKEIFLPSIRQEHRKPITLIRL